MSIAIAVEEIGSWARYIKEICGINLDETKGYLIETRLGGLLKETGSANFSDLLVKVKGDFSRVLRRQVINGITTNETSFFRDTAPFELLKNKILPECIDRKNRTGVKPITIRIWSAACSTGQEAYSIGMVLKELVGDTDRYDIRIVGTDISDRAVAAANSRCSCAAISAPGE